MVKIRERVTLETIIEKFIERRKLLEAALEENIKIKTRIAELERKINEQ